MKFDSPRLFCIAEKTLSNPPVFLNQSQTVIFPVPADTVLHFAFHADFHAFDRHVALGDDPDWNRSRRQLYTRRRESASAGTFIP